jgi:predicted phosphodiesterase
MPGDFRVALLADIHGNVVALEAVLADVAEVHPDRIIFMGDLVMNGPRPAETLRRVMEAGAPGVVGNTDQDVVAGVDPAGIWARRQLDPQGLAYLAALPLTYRLTPPGERSPESDLLITHATPRDCNDLLILALNPAGTSFTSVTPAAEAEAMLAGVRAELVVYGHIHYVSTGTVAGQRVMSLGSVGFPFDLNPAAAYALARWTGQTWEVEHRRVPYDHEAVAHALEESTIPFGARYAARLRQARWLARS